MKDVAVVIRLAERLLSEDDIVARTNQRSYVVRKALKALLKEGKIKRLVGEDRRFYYYAV